MRLVYAITLALFALGAIPPVAADTLDMPPSAPQSSMALPSNGMSMDQVRAKYGQPSQIKSAVGEPPITRWIYGDFTVYFEYQLVINSVPHRK